MEQSPSCEVNSHSAKTFPIFYGTQRFSNMVTRAHQVQTCFNGEMLAAHPTPKLEDHTLLAVYKCSFNTSTATLQI